MLYTTLLCLQFLLPALIAAAILPRIIHADVAATALPSIVRRTLSAKSARFWMFLTILIFGAVLLVEMYVMSALSIGLCDNCELAERMQSRKSASDAFGMALPGYAIALAATTFLAKNKATLFLTALAFGLLLLIVGFFVSPVGGLISGGALA